VNRLLDDNFLAQLRLSLQPEAELMRRGIFKDEDTGRDYFTGYSYRTLYDWDQYFEAIVQIYMGWPCDYIKNGVTIFLDHQQEDGLISRSVPSNEFHDPEHVKPFLAQIALLVYRAYGELDWIASPHYLSRMQRSIEYWRTKMDSNQNGLSEWMSAPHTGMDNQHERAGYWRDQFCEGVDLNCYLVREMRAFSRLLMLAGQQALAGEYQQKAEELAERIRSQMWDEGEGCYYDLNARVNEPLMSRHAGWASAVNSSQDGRIRVKSVSSFAVLWAKVATPEQARRMVYEHLFNPREFWTPYPIAALAKSERWYSRDWLPADLGCNWRARTWIPTNYMVYHGLRNYGYHQLAAVLAHYTRQLINQSGNREYYDSETGTGDGLDPFWGWSLLAHFMEYEEQTANCLSDLEEKQ
jgi:putative isomerase